MTPRKEAIIKSNCFKAAVNLYASSLKKGEGIDLNDHAVSVIYAMAIRLLKNGKDRYWKSSVYPIQHYYEYRFLKRVYIWLKELFWEKKKEVNQHG